jgi:hypothetical protein
MLSRRLDQRRKIPSPLERVRRREQRQEQFQLLLGQMRRWQVWWQLRQRAQKRHPLRRHRRRQRQLRERHSLEPMGLVLRRLVQNHCRYCLDQMGRILLEPSMGS